MAIITIRTKVDGTTVQVMDDGSKRPFVVPPIREMSANEVKAADAEVKEWEDKRRWYWKYNRGVLEMVSDTDIVVTDNSNQPSREDKSGQYQEAETHVNNIIQDFDKGNVTRTDTKRVYDRAGRALRDQDLARGIGKL